MMLSLLDQLREGSLSPTSFMFAETTRRLFNMELTSRREVEPMHTAAVNSIDIDSVEYRYLLSGSNRGSIGIHDLCNTSGDVAYTCKAVCKIDRDSRYCHEYSVESVQWYPFDTGMFTSSGMDGKLKIWDSATLKPADSLNLNKRIFQHNMSHISSHALIAVAMDNPHVLLVDMKSGSLCHELRGHRLQVISVKWSPSAENLLATGGTDNKILLWDIRSAKSFLCALDQHNGEALSTQKDLVTAHGGAVSSLRFSTDGLYLVSLGTDHELHLWDVAVSKNTLVNYGYINNDHRGVQIDLCYDCTVPVVFVPSKSRILMFDMFTGEGLNVLQGHFGWASCCAFRKPNQELYTGGSDHNILIWTPDTKQELMADGEQDGDRGSAAAARDNWSD